MERTRRSLLAGTMSIGVVGAAGCLGGGSDGNDGEMTAGTTAPTAAGCRPRSWPVRLRSDRTGEPDLDYRPVIVDPEADVVVQAFEDFTCGHCATYKLEHFPTIREEYIDPGEVRYEHWDFPRSPSTRRGQSPSPARLAGRRAAGRRGVLLVRLDGLRVTRELQRGGDRCRRGGPPLADPCAAIADAQFSAYEEASMSDRSEGESMGLAGTPTSS